MISSEREIRVARAQGPGVGRFLAASLVDALTGGGALVAIVALGDPRTARERVVEFVFAGPPADTDEIIRVGIDRDGQVLATELLRRPRRQWARAPLPSVEAMLQALGAGQSVARLDWTEGAPPAIVLTMASQMDFHLTMEEAPMLGC